MGAALGYIITRPACKSSFSGLSCMPHWCRAVVDAVTRQAIAADGNSLQPCDLLQSMERTQTYSRGICSWPSSAEAIL